MSPKWNLFRGSANCGQAEGLTKQEVERLATEQCGGDGKHVDADACRECGKAPCGKKERKPFWQKGEK